MTQNQNEGGQSQGTPSSNEPMLEGEPQNLEPQEGNQGSEGTPSPATPEPNEGAQSPFTFSNPRLQGKTPEEIEKVFGLLEHTVRDQGQQLSALHEQRPPTGEPDVRPKGQPSPDGGDEEFWKNPTGTIRSMMQTMLDQAIDPFKKDLARGAETQVIEDLSGDFSDFHDYLPVIRELARRQNVSMSDKNAVRALYYMAVGAHQKGAFGSPASNPPAPPAQPQGGPNMTPRHPDPAPPQHPASAQPLPKPNEQRNQRPLTETERRLAKEYGMSEEDYLKWQDGGEMILEPSTLNQEK